jgi:radical SAM protein with 4Fe4S-binding SPASM domain
MKSLFMFIFDKEIIKKIINKIITLASFRNIRATLLARGIFCDSNLLLRAKVELANCFGGITLQNINICNAKCVFCGGTYDQTRKKYTMKQDLYELLLTQIEELGGGNILFSSVYGEPLADKDFLNKVEMANNKNYIGDISLITNGTLIKKHGAENILKSGLKSITISTSAFSDKIYEKVYGLKYKNMYKNVTGLLNTKNKCESQVHVGISFRSPLSPTDTYKLPDFREISKMADSVNSLVRYDHYDGLVKKTHLLGNMKLKTEPMLKGTGCLFSIYNLAIYSNGDVGVCGCRDLNLSEEMYLGNIIENTLKEMWDSEKRKQVINSFGNNKLTKICSGCSWYKPWDLHLLATYNRMKKKRKYCS